MDKPLPGKWRFNIIFGLLIVLCLSLIGQLALAIHDAGPRCQEMAINQGRIVVPLPGRPGNIYFFTKQRPVPAATSGQMPSCYADPSMLDNEKLADAAIALGDALHMDPVKVQEAIVSKRDNTYRWLKPKISDEELEAIEALGLPSTKDMTPEQIPDIARRLAAILKVDPAAVQDRLSEHHQMQFCWIKRDISSDEVTAVEKLRKEKHLRGVGIVYEWRRTYPNNSLGSSVVGFCLKDGSPGEGVEALLHGELAASYGKIENLGDAGRRLVMPLPDLTVKPHDGNHVFLTIDSFVQDTLEKAVSASVSKFNAKWGVGIVMDPNTGEILAMCNSPSYDPNKFNQVKPDERKNRAFTDPYEPGSAFKPIIAALAVDSGLGINWQTKFNCEGGTYNANRGGTITDHGAAYGYLTLEDIIVHSSNVGMAKVGEKCGNTMLYDFVHRMGFGRRTQIQLPPAADGGDRLRFWPGESGGIVREPLKLWDGYSLRRIPFGQEISVTALQLATAYCALANGGELLQPRLVDSVVDSTGKQLLWRSERKVVRRVMKPETSRGVREAMFQVVERGTGKACQMDNWTCFGKTGTAQIAENGVYKEKAFTGSFVAGAPVNKPRLVCLISIYWPRTGGHYGATVAAPAVKEVLEKSLTYMDVSPDRDPNQKHAEAASGHGD